MSERDELDPVAAEFVSYRQAAREAFPPASAGVVFATAHTRAVRRRAAVLTTLVAALVALALTGAVVLQSSAAPQPVPPASPPNSGTPTLPTTGPTTVPPSGTADPTGGRADPPTDWQDHGNQVRFLDEQTAGQLREATFTLPEWPGSYRDLCPGGEYTFTDGRAEFDLPDYPAVFEILVDGTRGILADVDGVADDELLVPIGCGPLSSELSFGLLALAPDGSGFQALGYVMAASDEMGGPDRFYPDGTNIVVEVQLGLSAEQEQRRRYRWQESRFVQVAGLTEFPAEPADPTQSFPVHVTQENDPCGTGGMLSFENGTSGVWAYESEGSGISLPAAEYLLGTASEGTLDTDDGSRPATLVTLTCRRPDSHTETWVHHVGGDPVVRTGVDGVTGIVSHRIVDGLAEVTVATGDGEQTRRYRTDGYIWEPVS